MANYQQGLVSFLNTHAGVSQEGQDLLKAFVTYLEGQAVAATSKGPHRPKQGTITGSVWDICDRLALKGEVTRKAVREAGEAAGINDATVTTQYQAWKAAQKGQAASATPTESPKVGIVDPKGVVVA